MLGKSDYALERTGGWDTLGMRGTCSDGYMLRANARGGQIVPGSYADISAQTMLPTSHVVWGALWLGIATDAMTRARAFARAEARKRPGGGGPTGLRLAEGADLLHRMRAIVESGLRRYERVADSPDELGGLAFAAGMNLLKTGAAQLVVEVVGKALAVCGIAGYRNDSPYSLARHLRDAHSAALMVANDRILANTAGLLLALRDDSEVFA